MSTLTSPLIDDQSELLAALAFQLAPSLTPKLITQLLSLCGSFQSAHAQLVAGHQDSPIQQQIKPAQKQKLAHIRKELLQQQAQAERLFDELRAQSTTALIVTSPEYPQLLKELSTPPPLLFVQGDAALLHLPQLAIVGSRGATAGGLDTARSFARQLAMQGLAITSGMALGIDGAAHKGAMEIGKTVAVLGSGLDVVYPKSHALLREQIIESGGALVSEFLPGAQPLAQHFPQRNRIISGLSMGTLVVEAAIKSGSLITARYALNQGREVFAVPGSIHNPQSKGCHLLIREGATLVETAQDIMSQLGALLGYKLAEVQQSHSSESMVENETGTEHPLLAHLGFDPTSVDGLIKRSGMSAAEVNSGLLQLELEGKISNQQGMVTRIRSG